MPRPRKYKKTKRNYRKKTYNRRTRKSRKTKFNTKSNAKFIRKVVNRTLHPEKKRYNCFRVASNNDTNMNWALNGIYINSTDTNVERLVGENDAGNRSPWYWYQLNTRPVLASSDTFYSLEGSKMNLKYIYLKGHIRFVKLNANNASAKEILTRIGNLRLRIAAVRGDSFNESVLNKYNTLYDNVETLTSNTKNGINLTEDQMAWINYHKMTRKQYLYKNLKIWTAKKWKWNRWNKAQSAQGAIAEGSGTIVSHADTGGDEIMIPFTYIVRINKNIIYKQSTGNTYDERNDCNIKYYYCFESDCGIENLEYAVSCGAVGVFTDC